MNWEGCGRMQAWSSQGTDILEGLRKTTEDFRIITLNIICIKAMILTGNLPKKKAMLPSEQI
jgi:hypothetical protein